MSRFLFLHRAAILLSALVAAGCAVPQAPGPATDRDRALTAYRERTQRLAGLHRWQLKGRVTVQGPEESGQVRLRWEHGSGGSRMVVSNPFGQTLLLVESGTAGLVVRDDRGETYQGWMARAVLRERLGWHVPIERLRHWILGTGDRRAPEALDAQGRPRRLAAGPWRVAFKAYSRVEGLWLPQRLEVRRDGIRLRLLVDSWRLMWPADSRQGQAA